MKVFPKDRNKNQSVDEVTVSADSKVMEPLHQGTLCVTSETLRHKSGQQRFPYILYDVNVLLLR